MPRLTRYALPPAPMPPEARRAARQVGEGMWISLAEPFVVPLARPEERMSKKTHLCVPSLFIRSPRSAVRVRDPVVHAVQAQFAPCEIGPQPDRLARDPAAIEVVAPD